MMSLLLPPRRTLSAHSPQPEGGAGRGADSEAAHVALAARGASRSRSNVEELRMLIVDDDFIFADMLPRLLRKNIVRPVLHITSTKTPEEALRRLAQQPFDIILCDFDLRSSTSGIDVLEQASALRARPFRILISGHSPREIPSRAENFLDAFMDKPMTLRELVPRLTALLEERLGLTFDTGDGASP